MNLTLLLWIVIAFAVMVAAALTFTKPDPAYAQPAVGSEGGLPVEDAAAVEATVAALTQPAATVPAPAAQTVVAAAPSGLPAGWVMPLRGHVVPLSEVPDPVFSSEAMGPGFAIDPERGEVVSPVSGTVATFFPTGHAVGLLSDDGREILIHVGLDTVNLQGEGFTPLAAQGDRVEAGQPLLRFDMDAIRARVPSLLTPVIFTNLPQGTTVTVEGGQVRLG